MYSVSFGNNPDGPKLDFPLWEVKGSWVSREGSPKIRIYRNTRYKHGGYYLEFVYDEHTVFRCAIRKRYGGVRYFDLYGLVGLAYDPRSDVLQLSEYGNYYRAEE